MSSDDAVEGTESLPLPEYEVSQYFPRHPKFTGEEKKRLRREYGFVRAHFKMRVDDHRGLQRALNRGRFGTTYDIYLQRSFYYSIAAGFLGIIVGYLFAQMLATAGFFEGVVSPVFVPGTGIFGLIAANKTFFGMIGATLLVGAVLALGVWELRYHYPTLVVDNRRRNITFLLPNAIVMMFALSEGGMTLPEIIRHVAEADDAYGEVSHEFEMVARDMDLFGTDLYTALRNLRNLTPSSDLEQFIDDMLNVMESGGNVSDFFEEQSQRYLQQATESQEDFLELLAIMSEVFVVAFVAAPLFLVVILLIISILGGSQLLQLMLVIYAIIPLGMAGFLVLLSLFSEPYVYPETELRVEDVEFEKAESKPIDHPNFGAYRRLQRWREIQRYLKNPLRSVRNNPEQILYVSVPAALLWLVVMVGTGLVPTTLDAFVNRAIQTTTSLFVVPFLIAAVPFSFFHELKRGHEQEVSSRFPDTLNIMSSANNMGIPLAESLDIIARWSGGWFARELHVLRNDVKWNHDLSKGLLRFANRLSVPQVSLTLKLISEAIGSTQDLAKVLRVASEDTRNRYRLIRTRQRAMTSYVIVVIIGFLVYLLVILLLNASFLTPIADISAAQEPTAAAATPFALAQLPMNAYRMLFYHSVLIQAVGCGFLTGQLADNDIRSGLKYSVLLVVIATVVFQLV